MTVENTITDWEEYWKKEKDAKIAKQKERFAQLYNWLSKLSVARVDVAYYGGGDQGCVEGISYLDAEEKEMNPFSGQNGNDTEAATKTEVSKKELEGAIEEFICEALPDGWEINEGSSGTATITVRSQTVAFDHNQLVTKYHEWEEQWHIPTTTP